MRKLSIVLAMALLLSMLPACFAETYEDVAAEAAEGAVLETEQDLGPDGPVDEEPEFDLVTPDMVWEAEDAGDQAVMSGWMGRETTKELRELGYSFYGPKKDASGMYWYYTCPEGRYYLDDDWEYEVLDCSKKTGEIYEPAEKQNALKTFFGTLVSLVPYIANALTSIIWEEYDIREGVAFKIFYWAGMEDRHPDRMTALTNCFEYLVGDWQIPAGIDILALTDVSPEHNWNDAGRYVLFADLPIYSSDSEWFATDMEFHSNIDNIDLNEVSMIRNCPDFSGVMYNGAPYGVDVADGALCRCNLTKVKSKLRNVGNSAFRDCKNLTSVDFAPNAVIGNSAFSGCESLTSVKLTGYVVIGANAFKGCTNLSTLDLSEVTTLRIGSNAFSGTAIKKLSVPFMSEKQYCDIDDNAFEGMNALESVVVGNAMYVGEALFRGCERLISADVTLSPEAMADYEDWKNTNRMNALYENCVALENASLSEGFSEIPANTFKGCSKLKAVKLPEDYETIGEGAFDGCAALKAIPASEKLQTIGENAFRDCDSLKEVPFSEKLQTISMGAFYDCDSIKQVPILPSLESIGGAAFRGCDALEKVELPQSLEKVHITAFADCENLKTIIFHSGNTDVDVRALAGCKDVTIYAPNTQKGRTAQSISAIMQQYPNAIKEFKEIEVEPESVSLNKTGTVKLALGKTLTLKATVKPKNAKATLTWTSADKKIATVKDGVVTPVAPGTVKITVKTQNRKKASVKVKVTGIAPKKVTLNKSGTVILKKGNTLTLKATLSPKGARNALTWTTSNKNVAKVSASGKVTALKKGTAKITVKTANGKSTNVMIRVK